MNGRWIVVACFLTFGCAQPKPEAGDKPAKLIVSSCHVPEYPAQARRAEETGAVTVRFSVDAKGNVTGTSIARSSGFPLLDNAAADSLRKCHFEPAVKQGVAVESVADMQYVWKLEGPDPRETGPKLIAGSCVAIPAETLDEGQQGPTKTLVFVDKTGAVTDVELKQSSGSPRLDNAVLETLRTSCKFHPAMSKGTAVDAAIPLDYNWKPANKVSAPTANDRPVH